MNQEISEKQQRLHCKTPTIILSFISLIFSIISSVEFFVYYETKYTYYDEYYVLTTQTSSSELALGLVLFVLRVAPVILFIVYILKFFKDSKATIIVPIIFGYYAFSSLFNIITMIINDGFDIAVLTEALFKIIIFTLAIYSALKGFSKKIFIIPVVLSIASYILSMIALTNLWNYWIENELYLYFLMFYGRSIASAALLAAILLFAIKNKIPPILSVSSAKSTEITNPEQELRLLQERFNNGMISEEEYKLQRSEIINKL